MGELLCIIFFPSCYIFQYIFGEFSPDEFNQFFVTPRCYVELPPFNDKVSCISHSAGDDCHRIKFGVDEVMDADAVGMKVSSTLNPQAPEFILGCQPPQKLLPVADVPDGGRYDTLGSSHAEGPSMEDGQMCQDLDGPPGALGQRERKKKKKRPPGYYSYLEGSDGAGATHGDAPRGGGLVNGHATNSVAHVSEDMVEGVPPRRTCESPEEASLGLASLSDKLPDSGRHSPSPTSPPPPPCPSSADTLPSGTEDIVGVVNGLAEGDSANGADEQKDSCEPEEPLPPSHAPPAPLPAPPLLPAVQPPKSWASLFHNSKPLPGGPQAYVEVKNVQPAVTTSPAPAPTSGGPCETKEGPVHVSEDPLAPKLAEFIEEVKLIHKPVSLQPRGLINKGNWCYINATLQALIACPPMYHLMKSISMLNETQRLCTSTPMIDNFVRLVNEFSNMPVPPKPKLQATGDKIIKDIRPGAPFEPDYIYKLLTVIKSSLSEKGRQEDAEEYLGFILNGLHEEMLALKKLLSPPEEKTPSLNGPGSQGGTEEDTLGREEEGEDGSEEEWEQVGPRNRSSVTRQADFVRTPITDIFGGHIRSVVYQQSSRESATLQPFFTLQLDIQSEKVRTVQEALESLVARESVQGYTTKSKQEIEVSRRVTLEELPPVLVLHLKRFVFEKTGGCQKLVKNVDYPVDLEISKDLLSPGVRSKVFKGQRTYRLFAVVYHHGNSATGGHYTTDVFHIGLNGWLRIDDQAVKVISQFQVLKHSVERTAYLLYYRRMDLM
uniref:Ubiquitin carboxyl-terminal hydrolase n=1 Tax=Scleropages formosus TaxID=113540 RepID=A0A8C9T372_SCLFO